MYFFEALRKSENVKNSKIEICSRIFYLHYQNYQKILKLNIKR